MSESSVYCSPANAAAEHSTPRRTAAAARAKPQKEMMNTTGTPVIGARVAEEMWAADSSRHGRGSGRKDLARTSYKTARRAVPAPSYLARKKTAAGERPAKKKKGREYDRGDRREAIRMYLADEKVVDIAAAYGTHERTIYKWLRVSHFPSRIRLLLLLLRSCRRYSCIAQL